MGKYIDKILDYNVFECEYDKWKGKEELNSLQVEGMIFRFADWLYENGIADDTIYDVYNNTSGIRDGNRLDIHDNYKITDTLYEISYIYSVNGTVWAVLYDTENDCYYGEIEIMPV